MQPFPNEDIILVDVVVFGLCLLVFLHIRLRTGADGAVAAGSILVISYASEQLSIRLGETHCHGSSLLLNVSTCSSVNSIVYYLPWMYSCYYCGRSVSALRGKLSQTILVGLLHPLFCTMYEVTGANDKWWYWGTKVPALQERFFEVPVMAVAFHFFFGMSFSGVLDYARARGLSRFSQLLAVVLLAPLLAVVILTVYGFFTIFGISGGQVTLATLILSALYVLGDFLLSSSVNSNSGKNKTTGEADPLLLSISAIWYAFILAFNLVRGSHSGTLGSPHRIFLFFNVALASAVLCFVAVSSRGGAALKKS